MELVFGCVLCVYCLFHRGCSRCGKPKFDGFTSAKRDEVILKMDVSAGRGRGAERAVRGFEVKGWAGRISFSFVGGWTTSWNDVGRVTGLECIISSHLVSSRLISSHLISSRLVSSHFVVSRPLGNEQKQQLK